MTFGRWILGVAVLAAIVVPLAAGARAVRRRFLPELEGPTAVLADAVLTTAALVLLAELLGVVGLLEAPLLVAGAVAVGAGGIALGRRGGAGGARGGGDDARWGVLEWGSIGVAAFVFAAWVRRTLVSLDYGIGGADSTWYHLTFAAEFAEGSVTAIPYTDVDFLTPFYPANVELLHAIGMLAYGTAALSPLLSLAALLVAFLAGWCVGWPFGVAPVTLLATVAVLGVPTLVTSQAGEAKNDVAALAFLLAAAVFLLTPPEPRTRIFALAGAATGLAVGTKLNLLAPAGALLVATFFLHRRGSVVFAGAALVTGGYWFARNLFAVGNPLPFLGPLPQPDEPRSEDTLKPLSDYLFEADAWDEHFLPGLDTTLGPAWFVLVAGALAGAAYVVVRGTGARRALAAVALVSFAAYFVTPATAPGPEGDPVGFPLNVRYAIPALLLGMCLLAIAARRHARAVGAALAILVLVTQLAGDEVWRSDYRRPALVLLAAGLLALVAARRAPRTTLAACALALTLGLYPLERDFHDRQYTRAFLPYTTWSAFELGPVYAWARGQKDREIAVAGRAQYLQFPLRGPDLDNDVAVVARHGKHGSFTPITDCDELQEALREHTHAVVSPYIDIWRPFEPLQAPELACLRMLGTREILTSGEFHVFALR